MDEIISEVVLARELGRDTVAKGRRVHASGAVRSLEVSADGARISASVASEQRAYRSRAPYQQTISIKLRVGRVHVVGYCTCPVARDCKHVAAALLEHIARSRNGIDTTKTPTSPAAHAQRLTRSEPMPLVEPPPSGAGLSSEVAEWLDQLGAAAGVGTRAANDAISPRTLLYVLAPLDLGERRLRGCAIVRPISVRLRKDGPPTDAKPYAPENVLRSEAQRARYLKTRDLAILHDLFWLQRSGSFISNHDVALSPNAAGRYVLEALLATGRLHWGRTEGPQLTSGPIAMGEPRWTTDAIGRQRLVIAQQAAAGPAPFDAVLPLAPLHYVDTVQGLVGPIETGLPEALAVEVARAPAVSQSEAALVGALMRERLSCAPRGNGRIEAKEVFEAATDPDAAGLPAGRVPMLPLPIAAEQVEVRTIRPTLRLRLAMADARLRPHYTHYVGYGGLERFEGRFRLPVAYLAFAYDGEPVSEGDPRRQLERREGDTLVVTPRDGAAEAAALKRLQAFGFSPVSGTPIVVDADSPGVLFLTPDDDLDTFERLESLDEQSRFIAFSTEVLPRLEAEGWQIEIAADYPYRVAEGEIGWWADIGEGSGIDWFSFEVGIDFEGSRVNLVPLLSGILEKLPAGVGDNRAKRMLEEGLAEVTLFQELPDGRLLPIPGARLVPLVQGLFDLIGPRREMITAGKVRLNRAEAPALADFAKSAGAGLAFAGTAERLVELGRTLQKGRPRASIKPPRTFKARLRPYQAQGLAWMDFLREAGFGGVLADDMGLGKTVQALAFLAREKAEGRLDKPALIVAPTSVLPNWLAEAERFAPQLSTLPLRGPDRHMLFDQIAAHDVVLSTYPLLVRDAGSLLGHEYHVAILDEAQAIKNPKAAISETAHRIVARHRLALTGTPLENNLGEVWSLFHFLAPGLLGDATTFKRLFRTPIEKHGDTAAQAFLTRRLKPFMLRRTKEQVAPELPQKTEITELVRLEGSQRDLYETVRVLMEKRVREEIDRKGLAKSHIVFLDALLKLRQVCCDPRLLKMPQAQRVKESAKLERLMEMIPELLAEGRRILLFSQFTSMLALIETELQQHNIPYVLLTGETADRAEPVRRFQAGEVPLFLISLKAGGTGLNLTAADTVIHYDPWWNPAVERQATDRAHRIGQIKPVFVYRLIVEEGVEQAIELLKARKAALAEALFEGSAKTLSDLTEADVSALFAPLSIARRAARKAA